MPRRLGAEKQAQIRIEMGETAFSAQYMQAPLPAGGAIFKTKWLCSYTELPPSAEFGMIIHSWDAAVKPTQGADYSVCTVWGVTNDNKYYLIAVDRDRLDFPGLLRRAKDIIARHPPSHVLIEDAANGTALHQELANHGMFAGHLITPKFDKVARAEIATAPFESGRVFLPADAPWLTDYLKELTGFPNTRHDDQVDSTTQFIRFAEERRRLAPPEIGLWALEALLCDNLGPR